MSNGLSDRQIECLRLVASGVTSSKVIADRLGLAPSSVDNDLSRAAAHLGARGREEAAAAFVARHDRPESSVQRPVSRFPGLAAGAENVRSALVAAMRWLLDVPPIGGSQHQLNRTGIVFSILKVAVVSISVFAVLVLFGAGLLWLMDR